MKMLDEQQVLRTGADPGIYFRGQTKVPNRKLRRSARELRAKPEPRAKPEKKRGEGSGTEFLRKHAPIPAQSMFNYEMRRIVILRKTET